MKTAFLVLLSFVAIQTQASESCRLNEINYVREFNGIDYSVEKFYTSNCQNEDLKSESLDYQAAALGEKPFLGLLNLFQSKGFSVTSCDFATRPSGVVSFDKIEIQTCFAFRK